MNRTLGDMLRNYAGRNPTDWDSCLSAVEFAMYNAVNRSTGQSPFFLNYGFHPMHTVWHELDVNVLYHDYRHSGKRPARNVYKGRKVGIFLRKSRLRALHTTLKNYGFVHIFYCT